MAIPLLVGHAGDWPFAGALRGRCGPVAWAGCVAWRADPAVAWRAARALDAALRSPGPPRADRRRALSILWERLDAVDRDLLGPGGGDDLVLLLIARDDAGFAVGGVGLAEVRDGEGGSWVAPPHPLLGPAGIPDQRPGALTTDTLPSVLVGVPVGPVPDWGDDPLAACGAWQ